ncbi:ribosome maturation factor RimM [Desulfovibrio mangrovi]|uniref:ribosome maturation factor RimM n=1 Tax=Desulfovibrio mangrovi TaxID=2976983 RepID=UPI002245D9C0|nr:ribosome maturation factor RimM [Desulfovibrio mangrovi]UZP67221.1 ribosome maturation factor RimM [Desulfovibrio mangrovi]
MTDSRLLQIGLIVKPHGLRGEVCVEYYADSPLLLNDFVWLQKGKAKPTRHKVVSTRAHQGRELLLLEDCRDRNCAETLRNVSVLVPENALPDPSEDEVYLYQLEGLEVRLQDGTSIGHIVNFQFNAGSEVWVIESADKREVLFPATDEFVTDIDLDNGTVTIAPPEGLLDLYLGGE